MQTIVCVVSLPTPILDRPTVVSKLIDGRPATSDFIYNGKLALGRKNVIIEDGLTVYIALTDIPPSQNITMDVFIVSNFDEEIPPGNLAQFSKLNTHPITGIYEGTSYHLFKTF